MLWLCGSEERLMISTAVWTQNMNVRDRQTDRQTPADGWYRALRIASRGKKTLYIHGVRQL